MCVTSTTTITTTTRAITTVCIIIALIQGVQSSLSVVPEGCVSNIVGDDAVIYNCIVNVTEGTPAETAVFNINNAYDDSNAIISDLIFDNYFKVDTTNNQIIRTKKVIDREDDNVISRLTAPFQVHTEFSVIITVSPTFTRMNIDFYIMDINDNVPQFKTGDESLGSTRTFQVYENSSPNNIIAPIDIVDFDQGINGTANISLNQSSPEMFNYTIDYVGGIYPSIIHIHTLKSLDREVRDSYNFLLIASEGTSMPAVTTLNVTLIVLDLNDNSPEFEMSSFTANVSEGAPLNTSITQVRATDDDADIEYKRIYYFIREICSKTTDDGTCSLIDQHEDSWPFVLDRETGQLTLVEQLNYEDIVEYRVTIDASNSNSQGGPSSASVIVEVLDINDNAPEVVLPSEGNFNEGSLIDSIYATFKVTDADSPKYSISHMYLLDQDTLMNSTHFKLISGSQLNRIVLSSPVDRESQDEYHLTLLVIDSLNTSLNNSYDITIHITDTNDNYPIFDQIPNPIMLQENSPAGYVVIQLNATDNDIGTNAMIQYSLPPSSDLFPYQNNFSIGVNTGKITVQSTHLDREMTPELYLLVEARDQGVIPRSLSTNVTITINLLDVNDNPPIISDHSPAQIYIKENVTVGTVVTTINATDADEGVNAQMSFSLDLLSPVDAVLPFTINSSTGRIITNTTIDRETVDRYSLRVQVTDGYNTPAMIELTINIEDINDNRPYFDPVNYYKSLLENNTINTVVATITATDRDTPGLTNLKYYFVNSGSGFNLDPSTGVITTGQLLDREVQSQYELLIGASDSYGLNSLISANLTITVIDINDEIPRFIGSPYEFYIPEGSADGTLVGEVTVQSLEHGPNGIPLFSIDSLNVPFEINRLTGAITTTMILNREDTSRYQVVVRVEDEAPPPHYNTTTIIVHITDINDNPPMFDEELVQLTLSENQPVNTAFYTAQATDRDAHPNNITKYYITEGSGFQIDPDTGDLSLTTSLNYEQAQSILISITAKDFGMPDLFSDIQQVNVTVLDDNNTNITFPSDFPLKINVSEDASLNVVLLNFTGQDNKGNPKLNLNYYLTGHSGAPSTMFSIEVEPGSGHALLRVAGSLDRETSPTYILNITITDNSSPISTVTQFLTVQLLDVNDNAPTFSSSPYSFAFQEEQAGKRLIDSVDASDPDDGSNGTVSYHLQNDHSGTFSIDAHSGMLYQERSLDREAIDSYSLTVIASDGATPPETTQVTVVVTVTDINDNHPTFTPTHVEVPENAVVGTRIVTLVGHDGDIGLNGMVTFAYTPGSTASSHFQLLSNGTILVTQVPDYESQNEFIFFIRARDGGEPSLESNGNITIRLIDQNDNCPEFIGPPSRYNLIVPENSPENTFLTNITAVDADEGDAGLVRYTLENIADQHQFTIDSLTGELSLAYVLDYEIQSQHAVGILAYDSGRPRNRVCRQTVHINVVNVNEYAPVFDKLIYLLSVDENVPYNTVIGTVTAYDRDSNSNLVYSLSNVSHPNSIGVSTVGGSAQLLVLTELDYETQSIYTGILTATDEGGKRDIAEVIILINNLNDNLPQFTVDTYTTELPESTSIGMQFLTVVATDLDNNTNDALTYSITGGNEEGKFAIHSSNGTLYVNEALDYETKMDYVLSVQAVDTGVPMTSSQANVGINIINVNEHTPQFTSLSYSFDVTEEMPPGTVVGHVNATDDDSGTYGTVLYSLTQDNSVFALDTNTGVVTTLVRIDREATPTIPPFMVVASDSTHSSVATVTVTINDIDDSPPTFLQDLYEFQVDINTGIGTPIGTVETSDADLTLNVVYSITSSNSVQFQINSTTGSIEVSTDLTAVNAPYQFTITAADTVDSTMNSQCEVKAYIVSSNDHYPNFTQRVYTVEITENQFPLPSIVTVHADDPDTGSNAIITYSFSNGNLMYDNFSIDHLTGTVSRSIPLDYEAASVHDIIVYAQDSTPNHPRTATAHVIVNVINVNDNSPSFVNFPSSLTISSVPYIGVDLFQLSASDPDNSSFTFQLWSQTDKFSIDQRTGIVSNIIILNSSVTYSISFRLTDGMHMTQSSMTLIIDGGVSNSAPSFQGSKLVYETVLENASVGKLIATYSALNSPTGYYITCCNKSFDVFSIDSTNGALSLSSSLDYESIQQYVVVIEARKVISPSLRYSDYMQAMVTVSNVNEFTPEFSSSSISLTINENISPNTLVTQVSATDGDGGVYGNVVYSIIDGNIDDTFAINSTNGAISVRQGKNIDRETVSQFHLVVKAQDGGGKHVSMSVYLTIQDQNDSPPYFPVNYTIGVYEPSATGAVILRVQATDPDVDSALVYSLGSISYYYNGAYVGVASGKFLIDQNTGIITLSSPVDYETVHQYQFSVTASDSITDVTARVTVNVLDVNDNVPEFDSSSYAETIDELTPADREFFQVGAVDSDGYSNKILRFSLGTDWPPNKFVIDEKGGKIRVNEPIDFFDIVSNCSSSKNWFIATVFVTDGVHNRSASVTVTVNDVNNHPPVFADSLYDIITSETTAIGQALANITITDHDCGVNALFSTNIPSYYQSASSLFTLSQAAHNAESFQLKVKSHVTQVSQGVYRFRLQAYNYMPRHDFPYYYKSSYSQVTLTVLPNNTHQPIFTLIETMSVPENSAIDTIVGMVTANDQDLGISGLVNYYLLNESVPFTIDNTTGAISVEGILDYESINEYALLIEGRDNGYPVRSASSVVIVNITDVNDNPPLLGSSIFKGFVRENVPINTEVLRVNVTDNDLITVVRYSLAGDDSSPFSIDSTGIITTNDIIDYEVKTVYQFTVISSDGVNPQSDSANVIINVGGINDNSPILIDLQDQVTVDTDVSIGDIVTNIQATDNDKGADGMVTFRFAQPNEYLSIMNNGSVVLEGRPTAVSDRKRQVSTSGERVVVTVIATDGGTIPGPLNDTGTVTFVVMPTETPGISTVTPTDFTLIISMSAAAGTMTLVIMVVVVLIGAVVCRSMRLNKKSKMEPGNPTQLSVVPVEIEDAPGTVELRQFTAVTREPSFTKPSGNNTVTSAITDQVEERDGRMEERRLSPHTRSTSDLASSIATDTLNLTQEVSFPYSKDQLEAIYAANLDLLNDGSQASVHTFGSEGGGEFDGDEIENMYYAKYDHTDEDGSIAGDDDASSYDKDRNSISESSGGLREDDYHFSQSTNLWSSRRSINDLIPEGSRSILYNFDHHSQGATGYGGISTQDSSSTSLIPPSHKTRRYAGSNRELSHYQGHHAHPHTQGPTYQGMPFHSSQGGPVYSGIPFHNSQGGPSYYPHPGHTSHYGASHAHHGSGHTHNRHHRHRHSRQREPLPQSYEYYQEEETLPMPLPPSLHRESPIFDYRSQVSVAPPPYSSQDPIHHHHHGGFSQGSHGNYSSRSRDHLQYDQPNLSTSSTSLSTNASHPFRGRGYH